MSTVVRPSLIEIAPQSMRPTALPDHVYAVLKQRILSCAVQPNERLIEKKLCEELRISRTPLREALNRLSHEELVSFQPHAGYRVAGITLAGFRNLIELRSIVEPQAAALAAERATPGDIAALRAQATLPYDPSEDRSFVQYCQANSRFHLLVVRCARNPMLENIVMSALDMYQRPTYLRIGRQMDPGNPSSKHHAIVDAIEQHDAEAARKVMYRHIRGGGERIMTALRDARIA
ncbi:MAG: GntR family transcriptional regulator [Verrucomicrobia bacterium]|nr:GntR family transcriptional regulator [Verrucomicrobiota bacterium]